MRSSYRRRPPHPKLLVSAHLMKTPCLAEIDNLLRNPAIELTPTTSSRPAKPVTPGEAATSLNPGCSLVNGTGFQTRAGLAMGLQGFGFGSGILTLPKPVPTQTCTRTPGTGMVGREQKNKNK